MNNQPMTSVRFHNWKIPVAYSMLELSRRSSTSYKEYDLFQQYMCYWIAFNNIYATIGDDAGKVAEPEPEKNAVPPREKRVVRNGFTFVKMKVPADRDLVYLVFDYFSEELKDQLIKHGSTDYF